MPRHIAIVPAAGSGSRMGAEQPKQYLEVLGRPLLFYALSALANTPRIDKVVVVLSPDDFSWPRLDWSGIGHKLQVLHVGGATRAQSVRQALEAIEADVCADDWMLVHDAARACLRGEQIDALIDALRGDDVGGLLAVPVADTLKRASADGRVAATISRDAMWQAQTPQMFRFGALLEALRAHPQVTDEAGAMEAAGFRPKLVAADATNFKVTYPDDLRLAAQLLAARGWSHPTKEQND